jgi:type IV pilus assembly protein PilW
MTRQGGMTIIELMIAVTLGMIVTLLASSLLMTANAAYASQLELAHIDDAGRFALATIERAARQAGSRNWDHEDAHEDPATGPAGVGGIDAASLGKATAAMSEPQRAVANGSDVLALRFGGDGNTVSCAGFAADAAHEGWSIFYVGTTAGGDTELRCKYRGKNNWSADAVVAGVDSFQVLYGLDTDEPRDGTANAYVTASAIDTLDAELVLSGASDAERARERLRQTHWKRVASIRVGLVLHGRLRTRAGDKAAVFHLFGAAYQGDQGSAIAEERMAPAMRERERRAFSATIMLRNPSS